LSIWLRSKSVDRENSDLDLLEIIKRQVFLLRLMLRPVVRGIGRNAVLQCQRWTVKRRIHATPIRSIDDDKPSLPLPESVGGDHSPSRNDNGSNDNSQELPSPQKGSLPTRIREEISAEDSLLQRQQEREAKVEQQRQVHKIPNPQETSPKPFPPDVDFESRQETRQSQVDQYAKMFDISNKSLKEQSQQWRQTVYNDRLRSSEEANERGLEIFRKISLRRAEAESAAEMKGEGKKGDRPPREDRGSGIDQGNGTGQQTSLQERAAGRPAKYQKDQPEHQFSKNFNPSKADVQGLDEVDIELGYDLPDAPEILESFTIANRDGTVVEGRKTNRDRDELPDEAGSYIDVRSLGPIGRGFYSKHQEDIDVDLSDEQIEERIQRTKYPEKTETDINELMTIKGEIESGMPGAKRLTARRAREFEKAEIERAKEQMENVAHGTWSQLVPLPRPHRPETEDLDVYVPPEFTHKDFQYGVPPIPVGVLGRRRAAEVVGSELTDQFIDVDNLETQFLNIEDIDKTTDELLDWITGEHPDYPSTKLRPFEKYSKETQPIPRPSERPGETFDFEREVRIEDLYSDDQIAVWKEMHRDSFAPPDVKVPAYTDEDEEITPYQVAVEARQRIEAMRVIDQLDAATLRIFRIRDEMEIRDIRRRMGLPIVTGEGVQEGYYGKKRLDRTSP
jgi:hypothetical protein